MSTPQEPTRIHIVLGTVAFIVFLALIAVDAHPDYQVSFYLSALLVVSYLTLLGFGVVITRIVEAKYGGNNNNNDDN